MKRDSTKSNQPWSFATKELREISAYLYHLQPGERKALITLCRAQQFPSSHDRVLSLKTSSILPHIFDGYSSPDDIDFLPLTSFGELIQPLIESPLTTGLVLVLCLELPDDYDTKTLQNESWNKEMRATQTVRSESKWQWDILLGNDDYDPRESIIHPDFPRLSSLQKKFRSSVRMFKGRIQGKRVFPHYTRRGVSQETSDWIRNRVLGSKVVKHGSRRTFFRNADFSNLTSLDVIHYFIRTGCWPRGKVEMRQQWSPNLLVPRTYFAWGGEAISVSSYLRTFFNDLADIFPPTHRHNRVQPDWLRKPRLHPPSTSFYFYDLTSFTSWFHEQVPLLRSIARAFCDVSVDLVWEGLTIREVCVGDMVEEYIRVVNDFPQFYYRDNQVVDGVNRLSRYLRHYTAGFLGVPGNLVTCTLGHGLALASTQEVEDHLQVPGDDVGALTLDDSHRLSVVSCAQTCGVLQSEKVYDGRQASVYLKRGVRETVSGITLTDMVIYPIPSTFIHPDDSYKYRSLAETFKMPDRRKLVSRGAQIMVTFIRDLYKISRGKISNDQERIITDYLHYLHYKLRLPLEGIFQGQLLVNESEEEWEIDNIGVKFPVDAIFLRNDPDLVFADRYIEHMYVRDVSDVDVTWSIESGLHIGDEITVRQGRKWSFLRDMGYLEEIQKIGGDKVLLIGDEAKEAYLHSRKPPYTTFRVVEEMDVHQLSSVGFTSDHLGLSEIVFDDGNAEGKTRVDRAYRHPMRYRDWDAPIEVDYGVEADPVSLMSLGNDSMDLLDLY